MPLDSHPYAWRDALTLGRHPSPYARPSHPPPPRCVPFRLTRDIEDALGVAGVEGVLRSSAEHTMRVLRAHSDALITILQVFVRNPLYKWALDTTP